VIVDEEIDQGFYRLSHQLSHQCFDFNQLRKTLGEILTGQLGAADGDERKVLFDRYVTAQDGPLACDRIIDVIEKITVSAQKLPRPCYNNQLTGRSLANARRLIRRLESYFPGLHTPREFHRHRYPGISRDELQRRITRFQHVLGDKTELKADQIFDQVFCISPLPHRH